MPLPFPAVFQHEPPSQRFLLAAAFGGIAAGVVATLAQAALWLVFTDVFPAILWRDARLAAAILLGPEVLPPPATFDWAVMIVSTILHFGLSIAYGLAFCAILRWAGWRHPAIVGSSLGVALFLLNMYGFTRFFPWFVIARDWITVAAHVVFGITATVAGRWAYGAGRRGRTDQA